MIKVAICGYSGKMGVEAVKAVNDAKDMELVAKIGRADDSAEVLAETRPDVVVELTNPKSVKQNIEACLAASIPVVVGTTGLTDADVKAIDAEANSKNIGVLICPNFAIGAILMMQFAAKAAKVMDRVEILEYHHDKKHDAPSGTAIRTAELIKSACPDINSTPLDEEEIIPGARGADHQDIPIHAIRMPGVVANQDVVLGAQGQTLTISHQTLSRDCFMPGVLLCVRKISEITGVVVGLEHLLDEI